MKKTFYILILLVLSSNLIAQNKFSEIEKFLGAVGYIKDTKIFTEKIDTIDYEVWLKHRNKIFPKTFDQTGTCFFVYTEFDLYLVTANHVASFTTKNTEITISSTNDVPLTFKLGEIIKDKSNLNWTTHPIADVSVIELDSISILKGLNGCYVPFEMLSFKLEAPFREREVTTYGYPLSLGIGQKISPITKTSKPSSSLIELERFDNKVKTIFFLLDDPSVSGFSGGPVFELPQEIGSGKDQIFVQVNRIVGLVHGSISNKAGGFAAIVPSIYIKETIENAPGYNGKFEFKYPEGQFWSEIIYKKGVPWTVISNYTKDGTEHEKGTLFEGTGTLYNYAKDGKLRQIITYENGHLVDRNYIK